MARPRTGQPRNKRIALTLSPEILEEIRKLAKKEKCSISSVVELLLAVGLIHHCDKPQSC